MFTGVADDATIGDDNKNNVILIFVIRLTRRELPLLENVFRDQNFVITEPNMQAAHIIYSAAARKGAWLLRDSRRWAENFTCILE